MLIMKVVTRIVSSVQKPLQYLSGQIFKPGVNEKFWKPPERTIIKVLFLVFQDNTGCLLCFHTPWILGCEKMAHLTMDFTQYQMYSYIIPTYNENFIKIKQLRSPIQSPRLPEVRFKIYIPSGHSLSNICI